MGTESGKILPPGQIGELWVCVQIAGSRFRQNPGTDHFNPRRGASVMREYWNNKGGRWYMLTPCVVLKDPQRRRRRQSRRTAGSSPAIWLMWTRTVSHVSGICAIFSRVTGFVYICDRGAHRPLLPCQAQPLRSPLQPKI